MNVAISSMKYEYRNQFKILIVYSRNSILHKTLTSFIIYSFPISVCIRETKPSLLKIRFSEFRCDRKAGVTPNVLHNQ